MKKKTSKRKLKRLPGVGSSGLVMALARELFEVGVAEVRRKDGFSDGGGWDGLSKRQKAGWRSVGNYVSKTFKRHNR